MDFVPPGQKVIEYKTTTANGPVDEQDLFFRRVQTKFERLVHLLFTSLFYYFSDYTQNSTE
jgi:hypothetical protein